MDIPTLNTAASDKDPVKPNTETKSSSVGIKLALLLNFILLIAIAAGGFLFWQHYSNSVGPLDLALKQQTQNLTQNKQALDVLHGSLSKQQAELATAQAQQANTLALTQTLQHQNLNLMAKLDAISATDRSDWLLAEAEFLLRLANQRIFIGADYDSARQLIQSADEIIAALDEMALLPIRRAIAADLAALDASPELDLMGEYLKLAMMIEHIADLPLYEQNMPVLVAPQAPVAQGWGDKVKLAGQSILQQLEHLIIIRHRNEPVKALPDRQEAWLLQQNLALLFSQAQSALLDGEAKLFGLALTRAEKIIREYYQLEDSRSLAMLEDIAQLKALSVEHHMPDISRGQNLMQRYLDRRHTKTAVAQAEKPVVPDAPIAESDSQQAEE